jgi:lipoprotein-anchoring transpeptidase ErfK/SrfK
MEGPRILWSAPIGTGTGAHLSGDGQSWEFSTPRGLFQVQLKEKDPVWILPDWVFVERGEPVPPSESPKRKVKGMLGDAALYLTPEIAIHGTDSPDQLGSDISHGCIRISNADVRRLYDEVKVGTPVLIH